LEEKKGKLLVMEVITKKVLNRKKQSIISF